MPQLLKAQHHPLTKRLIQTINRANFGSYPTNRYVGRVAASLETAVEAGDATATYWLGMLNWDGWGVAQNRERALHLLQTAAGVGHRTAQHNLGVAYDNGYELAKSCYQAFHYFSQAARQGCKDSMHCIGSFYYWGEGVAQDYGNARYWYRKSAQFGHVDSMCDLARCYQRGVGGRKNQRQALRWFTKAVEGGSIRAMTWLGLEYAAKPIENWSAARHWLEQAAEHHQSHAMYLLGVWAESGWTDNENSADALFWFKKAAQLGHDRAALHAAELRGETF